MGATYKTSVQNYDRLKTQRLLTLPFDSFGLGGYYYRSWGDILSRSKPLPWYFRAWHWHIKKYIEPLYPFAIGREIKWLVQKLVWGYNNTDFWSLDFVIAKFMVPRLKEFRRRAMNPDIVSGYPADMDPCCFDENYTGCHCSDVYPTPHQRWLNILDDMIYFFEEHMMENSADYDSYFQRNVEKYDRGGQYFAKYFGSLWE